MEITVNHVIKAPELAQSLLAVAHALGGQVQPATSYLESAVTQQAPAYPVGVPTGVPTQQIGLPQYQPEQHAAPVAPQGVVPTTEQTYTMDQLAVAATQLMDAGRRNELVGLLSSYGVQALTSLPKELYGAFATQLRAMGAKI